MVEQSRNRPYRGRPAALDRDTPASILSLGPGKSTWPLPAWPHDPNLSARELTGAMPFYRRDRIRTDEVAVSPTLSVAVALMVCTPRAMLAHEVEQEAVLLHV